MTVSKVVDMSQDYPIKQVALLHGVANVESSTNNRYLIEVTQTLVELKDNILELDSMIKRQGFQSVSKASLLGDRDTDSLVSADFYLSPIANKYERKVYNIFNLISDIAGVM